MPRRRGALAWAQWRAGVSRPALTKATIGRAGVSRPALLLATACLLAGCAGWRDLPVVSKFGFGAGNAPADPAIPVPVMNGQGEVRSAVIADLQARRSILPATGAYAEVAQAVTEAGAGVAAAELRMARLRAEAKAKNWLPRLGPTASLNSLGAVAAALLLEQSLLDNGYRKAERAWAAADVELAAVTLASEANQRVYDGLKHHLAAERGRDQAEVASRAVGRLAEYERIMRLRVEGGISDRSEQQVLTQKRSEMQARLTADRQAAQMAQAQLAAMTSRNLAGLQGSEALPADLPGPEPLSVLQARGQGARDLAEAQMAKAEMMPSLSARVELGKGGLDGGLALGGGNFGPGSDAARAALEATGDLAGRRSAAAVEEANRRIVALQQEMASVLSQQAQGAEVLRQTGDNLSIFAEQYKLGRRTLLELVQQYESFAGMERDQVGLKYLAADLRLKIALERGVLVDGTRL